MLFLVFCAGQESADSGVDPLRQQIRYSANELTSYTNKLRYPIRIARVLLRQKREFIRETRKRQVYVKINQPATFPPLRLRGLTLARLEGESCNYYAIRVIVNRELYGNPSRYSGRGRERKRYLFSNFAVFGEEFRQAQIVPFKESMMRYYVLKRLDEENTKRNVDRKCSCSSCAKR